MRFTMKSWNWPHIPRGLMPPKTSKRRWYLTIPDSGISSANLASSWRMVQDCYSWKSELLQLSVQGWNLGHHLCLWKPTSSWRPESVVFSMGKIFGFHLLHLSETLTLFSRVYAKPHWYLAGWLRQPMGHRTPSVARKSTQTIRRSWLS